MKSWDPALSHLIGILPLTLCWKAVNDGFILGWGMAMRKQMLHPLERQHVRILDLHLGFDLRKDLYKESG